MKQLVPELTIGTSERIDPTKIVSETGQGVQWTRVVNEGECNGQIYGVRRGSQDDWQCCHD